MKTAKGLYVIVDPEGYVWVSTIRYWRRDSIASFLKDGDWKTAKKTGFRCVKFKVTFNEALTNKD